MTSQNLSLTRESGDDHDVNRDVLVRLLVTQAEKDAMQAAADREGITLSEWVRQCCFITTTTVQTTVQTTTITPPSIAASRKKAEATKQSVERATRRKR